MKLRYGILVLFALVWVAAPVCFAQGEPAPNPLSAWAGPDGPTPFTSFEEVEDFLLTARVEKAKVLSTGVTQPLKVGLVKDGIRMNAVFRHVDRYEMKWKGPDGLRLNFRDSFRYECASYRLSKLLGIDHVPPSVLREFEPGDFLSPELAALFPSLSGSLQAWVEDAMTELDRRERNQLPPSNLHYMRQEQLMRIYDNLIFNEDRNQGNILIGPDWKLWFIDASRAFRPFKVLKQADQIHYIDRRLYERLQALTPDEIRESLSPFLRDAEIKSLLARRDALLKYVQKLVQEKGERRILVEARP